MLEELHGPEMFRRVCYTIQHNEYNEKIKIFQWPYLIKDNF